VFCVLCFVSSKEIEFWQALVTLPLFRKTQNTKHKTQNTKPDQFQALHKLIQPQPGEARWASIPWRTNLAEARRQAVAENKPLFVWRAGGGMVLGRA
jgi:hypothetical protein